jgi:hypothetical protein
MAQRASGFARRPGEDYPTPAWVAAVIAAYLRRAHVTDVWEPAAGDGGLAAALRLQGFKVVATGGDFLARQAPPEPDLDAIITNPPYGEDKRAALAGDFIRHALVLEVRVVAMLLRVDFDSGKTRKALFRDCRWFGGKIVLLDRIKWFDGPSSPSDNHAWFVWDRERASGDPWIRYAEAPR